MSSDDDRQTQDFEAQLGRRLRDSADGLDAQTRSRLNQARQAALAELEPRPVWQRGPALTGFATAAVAALVVVLWQPPAETPQPLQAEDLDVPDLELLMADESLEMLEDLDFYTWLAVADLEGGTAG